MKYKENCPECNEKLHHGEHKFSDGVYEIRYCKKSGYRQEKPEEKFIRGFGIETLLNYHFSKK